MFCYDKRSSKNKKSLLLAFLICLSYFIYHLQWSHTLSVAVNTSYEWRFLSSDCCWGLVKINLKTPATPLDTVASLNTRRKVSTMVWCSRLKDFKDLPVWRKHKCVCMCVKRELVHYFVTQDWHTFKTVFSSINADSDTVYTFHWGLLYLRSRYKIIHWAVSNARIIFLKLTVLQTHG